MAENKAIVAILIEDQIESQNFAKIFNSMGFISKCYDDLEVFWHGTINEKISFCIVDVQMMSKGETVFKSHPKIKNEEMPAIFYYSQETSPLLLSTYEILNLGIIKKSVNYSGQLKGVMKRVNQFWKFKSQERENQNKIAELEEKIKSLGTVRIYNSFLYQEGVGSFFEVVERVFESWPDILKYSFFQLDGSGKKIFSPKQKGLKYQYFGEIFQEGKNFEGIDPMGQRDCFQVAQENFGKEFIALKLTIQKKYPEFIVLLKVKQSLDGFGWENFEKFLTGIYAGYKLKENFFETNHKEMVQPWELFDLLDDNLSIHAKKLTLVNLNLTSVFYFLIKDNKFDWKRFLTDFISTLKKKLSSNFTFCIMGYDQLAFLIDWSAGNELFDYLKEINDEFPYYNYFNNKEPVLGSGVKGNLKMIPSSVKAYLKYFYKEPDHRKDLNAF